MMREIARALIRGGGRLIVNAPPRHAKSDGASRWVPIWFLDNWPQKRVIMASYGDQLATHFGREVRNEFDTNPYLLTRLREDSQAANRWNTPQGGGMLSVGVGGAITGFGGDLIIIDDPHKNWEEAYSGAVRERVKQWATSTLLSRGEPGATIVVVMQRMHKDDLTGHFLKAHKDQWTVINMPALAETADAMGRAPGEALCPQRYDAQALKTIRMGMLPAAWDAMYQQNPAASSIGLAYGNFRQTMIRKFELRNDLPLQVSWDFNRNPGVICEVGQYDPRADAFTVRHEIWGDRWMTGDTADGLIELLRSYGTFRWPGLEVYGDASGSSANTRTADSDYDIIGKKLRAAGYQFKFKVPSANPPIKQRLDTFNDALRDTRGNEHYSVHPDCPRLITDLEEVPLDENALIDKSNGDLTHPSDAEGYRVFWRRPIRRPTLTGGRVGVVSR